MAIDFSKITMNVPTWVQEVIDRWESNTKPYNELEIAQELRNMQENHPELSNEDFKGYYAEWAAFLFLEYSNRKNTSNTYFGPMMTYGDSASPDLRLLDSEIMSYWEKRAESVASPVMRARYADLVWDMKLAVTSERPSYKYAQIAIDAYDDATSKRLYSMEAKGLIWLRRAFELSLSLRDDERTNRIVAAFFSLYDSVVTPRRIQVWIAPFDVLYAHWERLTPEQQTRLIDDLEKMLKATSGQGKEEDFDPHAAQAAAERLARHYKRTNDKTNVVRVVKAYGLAFQRTATQASPMLAMAWLQPVIERYEQEGLKKEAEELQLLSAEKGKNIAADLKTVRVETQVQQEEIDELTQRLLGANLQTALTQIAGYFIPKVKAVKELLEKLKTDAPLLSTIPIVMVEKDGHPSAKIGTLDEDPDGRLHEQLSRTIGFYQPFLVHTLAKLNERYSPTVEQILDVLRKSPLFPKEDGTLLQEGLQAYVAGDFVKAIHILVPQVEHILRNFLGSLGIPTLKTIRNHPGIMDAKSMNDILGDERMREVLTENLWRYLTVVYIDKRGMNLRNDLAHGLVGLSMFNKSVADRVFHTLLALGLMRQAEAKQ